MNLFNYFQILLLFAQLRYLYGGGGTVTQSPSFACAGESITVSCVLTVPDAGAGDEFSGTRPNFIIENWQSQLSEAVVDGTGTANGFDLSGFTADTNAGNNTVVSGSITLLSYINNTDEGLRMGCIKTYLVGGSSLARFNFRILALVQAGLPSISTPIVTIQNFNPSTCEGTLRFNLAATSDRDITSYSILFNGSSIASLPSSNTEFIYNTPFLLNTNYPTSIIATSCAGNSVDGDASVRVNGYMQSDVSCAQYNSVTGALIIEWTVNTPSQPTGVSGINITYSVRVTYSHSNGTVIYLFTENSNFNRMSFVTTYDVPLTAHNFTNPQRVETNIIAHLRILQQCGQDLVGTELSCSLRSVTANPPINPPAVGLNPGLITGVVLGIVGFLFILIVILVLLGVCVYYLKSRDRNPKQSEKKNLGESEHKGDDAILMNKMRHNPTASVHDYEDMKNTNTMTQHNPTASKQVPGYVVSSISGEQHSGDQSIFYESVS